MRKVATLIFIFLILTSSFHFAEDFNLSGENYILMEEVSGRILLEKNAHEKMPMASTTKIMTALLALEKGNLDDYVLITEKSVREIGSSIYLELNEKIKLKDLIYGLMLRSGNDASTAIAMHISGSVEKFVNEMNNRAKSIGANNTNFMNPHGLHDDNHYSTPYDMALITREAMKNKDFLSIWATKTYTSQRDKNNYFINKNKTLWEYDGGDGGKTGYTSKSGRCLVSTASRDNMRLIAVSFNASDWFNDNYKLFDFGFDNYSLYTIYNKGQLLRKLSVENGSRKDLVLVSDKNLIYPLDDEELKNVSINLEVNKVAKLPIVEGENFGYVTTYLDGKIIRNDNLIAKYGVKGNTFFHRIKEIFSFGS